MAEDGYDDSEYYDPGESGDHSPSEEGIRPPGGERAMDGPFFFTALFITIALIAIVFFIIH